MNEEMLSMEVIILRDGIKIAEWSHLCSSSTILSIPFPIESLNVPLSLRLSLLSSLTLGYSPLGLDVTAGTIICPHLNRNLQSSQVVKENKRELADRDEYY